MRQNPKPENKPVAPAREKPPEPPIARHRRGIPGHILRHEIVATTTQIAGARKSVVFRGTRAYTDNATIVLPFLDPTTDYDIEAANILRAYSDHEAAHCRYTDWRACERNAAKLLRPDNVSYGNRLRDLYLILSNTIDDRFIEHKVRAEFPGTGQRLDLLRSHSTARRLDALTAAIQAEQLSRERAALEALLSVATISNDWSCTAANRKILALLRPSHLDILDVVESWEPSIRAIDDAAAVYDYAYECLLDLAALVSSRESAKREPEAVGNNRTPDPWRGGTSSTNPPEIPGTDPDTSPTAQNIDGAGETGDARNNRANGNQDHGDGRGETENPNPRHADSAPNIHGDENPANPEEAGERSGPLDAESAQDRDEAGDKPTCPDQAATGFGNPANGTEPNGDTAADSEERSLASSTSDDTAEGPNPTVESNRLPETNDDATGTDEEEAAGDEPLHADDRDPDEPAVVAPPRKPERGELDDALDRLAKASRAISPEKSLAIEDAIERLVNETSASRAAGTGTHSQGAGVMARTHEFHIRDAHRLDPMFRQLAHAAEPRHAEDETPLDAADPAEAAIRRDLGRLLMGISHRRTRSGLPEGRLDRREILGLAMGSSNVFFEMAPKKMVDTVLMVLLDQSASTTDIIGTLTRIGFRLAETEAIVPRLRTGLMTFTSVPDSGVREAALTLVVKRFDESISTARRNFGLWQTRPKIMRSTPTAEATLAAARHLEARKETRRILMTITDGRPDDMPAAMAAIRHLNRRGIETCILEIGAHAIAHTPYTRSAVARDIAEVPQRLKEILTASFEESSRHR